MRHFLSECIEFFHNVTGANIHVQWKALEAAGVTRNTPVHIHFRSLTLRKALTLVLSSAAGDDRLAFVTDGNVLEITTPRLPTRSSTPPSIRWMISSLRSRILQMPLKQTLALIRRVVASRVQKTADKQPLSKASVASNCSRSSAT